MRQHKRLPKTRTAPNKTAIKRQIAATDKQIDRLTSSPLTLSRTRAYTIQGG